MITAAEKFDLVPPWCVVKKGYVVWCVVSHDDTHLYHSDGMPWHEPEIRGGYIATESEARRIARLTRPLPSWEPAPDCALPVEGWCVDMGLPSRDWCVVDGGGTIVRSGFPTRRAAYVWAWTEAEHTDGTGARVAKVEGDVVSAVRAIDGDRVSNSARHEELHTYLSRNSDRIAAVEGVLARIGSMESFIAEAQALANRMTIVERLVAASVPVPAKVNVRSDAASTNAAMTEAAASDEGWREMLVPIGNAWTWWMTPDGQYESVSNDAAACGWEKAMNGRVRRTRPVSANDIAVRAELPLPPNLAEWWKPGAKVSKPDEALVMSVEAHRATCDKLRELHAFVKSLLPRVCECCRESIKAALGKADIPDDVLKL